MKKFFKTVISSLLVIVMTIVSIPSSAETKSICNIYGLDSYELNKILDYAEAVLPSYLKANNNTPKTCNISYPIYIDNYSSYMIFVISEENEIIGRLSVGFANENIFSSFSISIDPLIKAFYNESVDTYFTFKNGNIYAFSAQKEFCCVEKRAVTTETKISQDEDELKANSTSIFNSPKVQKIRIAKNINLKYDTSYTRSSFATLNVNHVANTYVSEIDNYICWAACTAMAVNYMERNNNNFNNLTAIDVYNDVKDNMDEFSCDNDCILPDGCKKCINYSYSHYNHPASLIAAPICGSEMYSHISSGKAVQINIKNSTSNVAHAVIVKAVMLENQYVVYTIVDPSKSVRDSVHNVSIAVSPTTVTDRFIYTGVADNGSSITYNDWYRTFRMTR